MSRSAGFAIALGLAVVVALLLSIFFFAPECSLRPTSGLCLVAEQRETVGIWMAGLGFVALAIATHLKASRRAIFLGIVGVAVTMVAVQVFLAS